ncbi:hypothetical protein [Aliiroseovarius sp.]|uniref:hypothetical protein n=1 Tax=Aliiroseovarius sp. TaxID=1872442 RepID=UPI003BAD8EBD
MKQLLLILPLAACAQPDTIANPLAAPARAINATVEAASPEARRARVAQHVTAHHAEILSEIAAGGGIRLSTAMELAWIAAPKRAAVIGLLAQDIALFRESPEALVSALMLHGA